jgi:gluconate 5-dehydrogenase
MKENMNLFSVAGKRVLITGSTRGIGYAMAQAFADAGAVVVVTGRSEEAAAAAARELGGEARGYALDVSSEESVLACAARVDGELGGVDVLINNAGIDPHYANLEKTTSETWRQIIATNLDGVFYCCKHFTGAMRQAGSGSVINISSVAGKVGLRRQAPYTASKGGVEQLTRTLALDWADSGIRVNGIGYGFIETDLTSAIRGHQHLGPQMLARTPMARFGKLSEVAGAAIFLASGAASYVTGHTLMVDGGWTAS